MTEVVFSRRALRDLNKIDRYSIANFGTRVADQYMAAFDRAVDLLMHNPGLLRENSELSGRLLFYRVREHLLICGAFGQQVFVPAVVHGSMDLARRLAEMEPRLLLEAEILGRKATEG